MPGARIESAIVRVLRPYLEEWGRNFPRLDRVFVRRDEADGATDVGMDFCHNNGTITPVRVALPRYLLEDSRRVTAMDAAMLGDVLHRPRPMMPSRGIVGYVATS